MHPRTFVAVLAMTLMACKGKTDDSANSDPAPEYHLTVDAAHVSAGALKQLPWLLGTFRGTDLEGTMPDPFFERNVLADDSTLLVLSFHDSTLTGADTTRYELRRDSLTNTGDGRYIATAISADSVAFGPLAGVNNFFTWRRDTDSSWLAFIYPFDNLTSKQRRYRMTRVTR